MPPFFCLFFFADMIDDFYLCNSDFLELNISCHINNSILNSLILRIEEANRLSC